jgi:hypothetical protein
VGYGKDTVSLEWRNGYERLRMLGYERKGVEEVGIAIEQIGMSEI